MSPVDDHFLTSSADRTVQLWNIQHSGCLAVMTLPFEAVGTPHACFDSTGLVFAITAEIPGGMGNVSLIIKFHVDCLMCNFVEFMCFARTL